MKKKFAIGLLLGIFLVSFALVGSARAIALGGGGGTTITMDSFVGTTLLMGDKVLGGIAASVGYVGTATPITLSNFTLTTFPTPANNPGFIMTSMPLAVVALGSQDLTMSFVVATLPTSGMLIDDVSVSMVGGVIPGVTGGPPTLASATIEENVYTANPILGGTLLGSISIGATGTSSVLSGSISFAPVSSIFVIKDISVNGDGINGGAANISQVIQQFSQVPVPVPPSVLFFAPGLLGLVGLRKRFFG